MAQDRAERPGRSAVEDRSAQPAQPLPPEAQGPDVPVQYLIGVSSDGPFQNLSVGGFGFPRYTEDKQQVNGQTQATRRPGCIVALTLADISRIREGAQKKLVRGSQRNIIVAKDERYRPQPFDEPVSKWIYLVPAPAPGTLLMQAPAGGTGFEPRP